MIVMFVNMKTNIMKTVRKISHLHLHLGMWFAVAILLVTALHTSKDMIQALYRVPAAADGDHMMRESREAETHIAHAQISFVRKSYIGGA